LACSSSLWLSTTISADVAEALTDERPWSEPI